MDVAHNRSLGFAGKEILFRKVEFERYRKPHVVEYPRSAIVLNPQHTRQLKDSLHHRHHGEAGKGGEDDEHDEEEGSGKRHTASETDSDDDDDDDPRRMDANTLLCSDAQLRSSLHLRWLNITPVGVGLVNLGNTCFANSVLQAIAHVPALAQYFMHTFRSADNQLGAPYDFAFALAETFRKMHHTGPSGGGRGGGSYRPGLIMGNLRLLSKHFSIGRQSDAHEFAVQLLFACQKSLLHRLMGSKKVQPRVAQTTALYRICGGYLLSQVTWSRQEEIQQLQRAGKKQEAIDLQMEGKQAQQRLRDHPSRHRRHGLDVQTLYSNTYDPFTILSVELAGHTLMHCLDKFCLAEELDGRCYHSPREVGVRAKKKFSIHVPPPVLMIHLKRFGHTGNKLNKHVHFPLELDITRYCTPLPSSSSSPSPSSSSSGAANAAPGKEGRADCQYELNAICVHEGSSINYGHYYTMAKAPNGMWYEFNDSHVSRLTEEQLQRAQAYMLCYSRVPVAKKAKAAGPSSTAAEGHTLPGARGASEGVKARTPSTAAATGLPLPGVAVEPENVGRALTDAEVEALLEKRRRHTAAAHGTATAATPQPTTNNSGATSGTRRDLSGDSDSTDSDGEQEPPEASVADRARTLKRMREDLPTDSDDEAEERGGERDGSYVRPLRPRQRPRAEAADAQAAASDTMERDGGAEATARRPSAVLRDEGGEASTVHTTAAPGKSSLYGGLIKSMKRITHDKAASAEGVSGSTNSGSSSNGVHYRVGRQAVNALHARKVLSTPDTVKRPATAAKFQQRIRDPMWEMEMDKGKVKKVKSKEKAPDPFEGTNPFQEVSRGMFDVRGRRRRD